MAFDVLPPGIQNFLSWQARLYAGEKETLAISPGPFVTVSREYGCEGHPVATRLASRLNEISPGPTPWIVMGGEVIETIAQKKGDAARFVDALAHDRRGYIRQTVDVLFGNRPTEYQAYETLVESLVSLAQAGRVILLGKGGAVVCGDVEGGAHIRLVAPLRWRAEKISRERGVSLLEAESIAAQEEGKREAFVRDFTDADVSDPLGYDAVFNNGRMTPDAMAEATLAIMKRKGIF